MNDCFKERLGEANTELGVAQDLLIALSESADPVIFGLSPFDKEILTLSAKFIKDIRKQDKTRERAETLIKIRSFLEVIDGRLPRKLSSCGKLQDIIQSLNAASSEIQIMRAFSEEA